MNIDYTVHRDNPVIKMFARDEEGDLHTFTNYDFKPYFYVKRGEGEARDLKEEGSYTGIRGEDLVRINAQLPRDVGNMRDKFDMTWEADINFPIRFMIDKELYCGFNVEKGKIIPCEDDGKIRRKRVYVDIETETFGEVPDQGSAPSMILCIVLIMYDPNADVERVMEFGQEKLKVRGSVDILKLRATSLEEEANMLKSFCRVVNEFDPDDITGWNVHFDMCTIINRAVFHKVNINKISPMNYVTTRTRYQRDAGQQQLISKILGRSVVDLGNMKGIPNCFASYFGNKTFESYKLRMIAAGDPKKTDYGLGWPDQEFDYKKMNRQHSEFDIDEIVEYCETDVLKTFGLDMKLNLIDHFDSIRRISGGIMDKSLAVSSFADILMLRMFYGYRVAPTRSYDRKDEGKYKGAEVIQPQMGFFKQAILMDFKQMYPLNAICNNMSPETVTDYKEGMSKDEYFIVGNVAFKKESKGKFPEALELMIALRDHYKDERRKYDINSLEYKINDLKQYSVKQMTAAMYGFTGFKGSRFFDRRIASSITRLGRQLIGEIIVMAQKKGYNVLYGDTDGIMVEIPVDFEELLVAGEELESEINDYYKEVARKTGMIREPKVEFEKIFLTLLFSGKKKRYSGRVIWEEGKTCDKIYVRGFELRSSITAISSKEIQTKVIEMICYEKPESEIREVVLEEVEGLADRPWKEIGIPKTLKKNLSEYATSQANYLGVHYANRYLGKNLGAGDRALLYWVKSVPDDMPGKIQLQNQKGETKYYPVNRVALETESDYQQWLPHIDWDVQKEKIIEAKIEKVLIPYGLSMSEIMSRQKQMKFGENGQYANN